MVRFHLSPPNYAEQALQAMQGSCKPQNAGQYRSTAPIHVPVAEWRMQSVATRFFVGSIPIRYSKHCPIRKMALPRSYTAKLAVRFCHRVPNNVPKRANGTPVAALEQQRKLATASIPLRDANFLSTQARQDKQKRYLYEQLRVGEVAYLTCLISKRTQVQFLYPLPTSSG